VYIIVASNPGEHLLGRLEQTFDQGEGTTVISLRTS
jgi:hypothetical protein